MCARAFFSYRLENESQLGSRDGKWYLIIDVINGDDIEGWNRVARTNDRRNIVGDAAFVGTVAFRHRTFVYHACTRLRVNNTRPCGARDGTRARRRRRTAAVVLHETKHVRVLSACVACVRLNVSRHETCEISRCCAYIARNRSVAVTAVAGTTTSAFYAKTDNNSNIQRYPFAPRTIVKHVRKLPVDSALFETIYHAGKPKFSPSRRYNREAVMEPPAMTVMVAVDDPWALFPRGDETHPW